MKIDEAGFVDWMFLLASISLEQIKTNLFSTPSTDTVELICLKEYLRSHFCFQVPWPVTLMLQISLQDPFRLINRKWEYYLL